jgi:hypothetical protein
MRNAVTGYLSELNTALRVGARRQQRIRAEVSDHLAELIAEERERGTDPALAGQRAVERFGVPAELAAEFNTDIARHGMNRASWAVAGCGAAAFVAAGFSPHATGIARPWPGAYLTLAIGYGGRQEIVDAVRDLLGEADAAGTSMAGLAERLTADDSTAHLYTVGRPDPDLVIRTSGEQRMSNFLLWQSAYSELYFCEAYWPAFREIDFLRALRSYAARKRRFGS